MCGSCADPNVDAPASASPFHTLALRSIAWGCCAAVANLPPFLPAPGVKTSLAICIRLGADPILLAQRSKIQRSQRLQCKLSSLIHRFTLFPRHYRSFYSGSALKSVTYVLNLLCYLCPEPA